VNLPPDPSSTLQHEERGKKSRKMKVLVFLLKFSSLGIQIETRRRANMLIKARMGREAAEKRKLNKRQTPLPCRLGNFHTSEEITARQAAHFLIRLSSGLIRSIGRGNIIVEFFSAAMLLSV
jgi:hypothetical protein